MEAITVAATSCSSPSLLSQSSCFYRQPTSIQAFNSTATASASASSSSSFYSLCRIRPSRIAYGSRIHNPLFSSNLISTSFPKMPNNPRFKVSAVFDRFTEKAIKVVIFSQREARAMGSNMVFTPHLLLGLIAEDSSPDGFLSSGITIDKVRDAVRKAGTHNTPASKINIDAPATDVPFSISSKRVFEASVEYSRTMGSNFIAPEHIAIALLTVGTIGHLIKSLGADANHLASLAFSRLQGEHAKDGREPLLTVSPATSKKTWDSLSAKKPLFTVSPKKQNGKSKLAQFCVDLTARAVEGFIDPVIGRDTEIQRIVQILCRRSKNNCVLLGEPGVGKTAIAEGLAIRIAEKETPNFLWEKRILSLDVGLLMAGAKERGELETRVTGLLTEVKKSGDVILFIDEVHTLIGSGVVGKGNKSSGLDIANLLKPSLGRGELQCIASTTIDEHRTHFEKDKALARRFQPVFIDEPSQEDTIQILIGLRDKYEAHHKCRFTLEAINAAVYLSERYIPDRYLPDKAIDLIDEAGSRACMNAHKRNKEQQTCILSKSPDEYWQEIRAVQTMHDVVIENKVRKNLTNKGDGELSSEIESKIGGSFLESSSQHIEYSAMPICDYEFQPVMVGPEDIAAVTSLWSGIPVQKLTADDRMLLIGLDEKLKGRVVGQDDAVSAISRAVKRSRVGLNDPNRPIATMLFCGPTGVGKTELTKALAACYFGSETAMLRLDMSEYMERHTVSKLIGSPPGYIGYGEGGTLTEAIRRRPFTVLLLDEIEKAHSDIFNILLQVFEDGHLTDSQGRRVSFKNTLIVMTSNVGSDAISNGKRSIGFMLSNDSESNSSYAEMKETLMEELKAFFRPELLNRVDEVVVFRPLEKTQMLEILDIMLEEVKGRIEDKGINLKLSEAILNLVCEKGYDRSYGARPLRRAVTQIIEDILGESMLSEEYKKGDTAVLDVDTCGNPFVTHLDEHHNQLASS